MFVSGSVSSLCIGWFLCLPFVLEMVLATSYICSLFCPGFLSCSGMCIYVDPFDCCLLTSILEEA